jgi:hypothetical protein
MPEGRQRYFNNDGTPCAGGKLWTYAAGTSTPKPTYANEAGTVPNPNPVPLDAKGEAVIYWSGAYKVDLKQADGQQVTGYPVDNYETDPEGVLELFESTGSSKIGHGPDTVKSALDALRLADYAALRGYTGQQKSVILTGYLAAAAPASYAGMFVRDDSDHATADDSGACVVDATGRRWKRIIAGGVLLASQFGAVAGVQVDQAARLQAGYDAATKRKAVFVVDGEYYVLPQNRVFADGLARPVALQIPSNSKCVFLPGAALRTLPNALDTAYVINAYLAENFELWSPVVYGERAGHTGTTGEWQHCYNFVNCVNGYVHRPVAYDAWGDGIYLGIEYYNATLKQTKNVTIFEAQVFNCRRNGISVTSGINLHVVRPYCENTSGAWPMAGIDCEPESAGTTPCIADGWHIDAPTTVGNQGGGVVVYTNSLPAGSVVDIRINDHRDTGSTAGFVAQHLGTAMTGSVVVTNPRWSKSGANALVLKSTNAGPRVYVRDPIIENCAEKQTSIGWQYDSAINAGRDAGEASAGIPGNFEVTGARIRDTRTTKKTSFPLYTNDGALPPDGIFAQGTLQNAVVEIVEDSSLYAHRAPVFLRPDTSVKLKFAAPYVATVDAVQMPNPFFNNVEMAENAPANVFFTLSAVRQPFRAFHKCPQNYSMVVRPQADGRIYGPLVAAVGQGIYSNDPGADIELVPVGAKDWVARIIAGTWVLG